jgi:toxin-antitoxin system PIN domain toxin
LRKPQYLLDVNVLIALAEPEHVHHQTVMKWFNTPGLDWGLCAFSEAGFLRVTTNPKAGSHSVQESTRVLADLANHRGYRFWPISAGWAALAAPFHERVFGHQQITDAYMLGLAVKENGVLVTMDKAIKFLAGAQYSKNVLVLESSSGSNA